MTARRIDGILRAEEVQKEAAARAAALRARGIVPTLAMMRIGEDPASIVYLRKKAEASQAVGVATREVILPADADPVVAHGALRDLNADPDVHGILLQLPLPEGFNATELLDLIDPA
jgi:methylenetetrahydrofolate dehydrogenase (NADP+)/methenyltetrahydrofolate cyclohydrolase